MNIHRWDDDLFDDSDDDDSDLSKNPDVAEIEAEISSKRDAIDELEKQIDKLENRLDFAKDKAKAAIESGLTDRALKRVSKVGLRDYWTAPHNGGTA